jgi:hypothetical protein
LPGKGRDKNHTHFVLCLLWLLYEDSVSICRTILWHESEKWMKGRLNYLHWSRKVRCGIVHISLYKKRIPDKREWQPCGSSYYVETISRCVKVRWHCYIRTSLKNNENLKIGFRRFLLFWAWRPYQLLDRFLIHGSTGSPWQFIITLNLSACVILSLSKDLDFLYESQTDRVGEWHHLWCKVYGR